VTTARPSTISEAYAESVRRLTERRVPDASTEAGELLATAIPCRRLELPLLGREPMSRRQHASLRRLLRQRCRRKPLAYILGEWTFADVRLRLNRDVLIPRPETEELFEFVLKTLTEVSAPRHVADIGTGSGCLAVTLAKHLPGVRVTAVDISRKALRVAKKNAVQNGVAGKIRFVHGDLLAPLRASAFLNAVVANLPYVARKDFSTLAPELRYEPRRALAGGPDGLSLIRRLIPQAMEKLKPTGWLFLEVGHGQSRKVRAELRRAGFEDVAIKTDMAGIERFLAARKPKERV